MIRQIVSDYPGLPDFRTLSIDDIKFFYKALIPGLIEIQNKESGE